MNSPLARLFLLVAAASVSASLELPQGTDLPLPNGLQPDTLDAETWINSSYLIPGIEESRALAYWKSILPASKFDFDLQAKTYASHDKATLIRTDSAGLTAEVEADGLFDAGAKVHSTTHRGYDARGRRIVEYVYSGINSLVPTDSTRWIWNHEGCADVVGRGYRWVWSVGTDGHCKLGAFLVPASAGSGWVEDHQLALVWSGRRLLRAYEIQSGDTLSREEYSYRDDSLVTGISGYSWANKWYLAESTVNSYAGKRLLKSVSLGYDTAGAAFAKVVLAARLANAGVHPGRAMQPTAPTARFDGSRVVFSNPSTNAVDVVLAAPNGTRLDRLRLDPGQILAWKAPAVVGIVVWTVAGQTAVSGTVMTGR